MNVAFAEREHWITWDFELDRPSSRNEKVERLNLKDIPNSAEYID
jgi:hypothetical protein